MWLAAVAVPHSDRPNTQPRAVMGRARTRAGAVLGRGGTATQPPASRHTARPLRHRGWPWRTGDWNRSAGRLPGEGPRGDSESGGRRRRRVVVSYSTVQPSIHPPLLPALHTFTLTYSCCTSDLHHSHRHSTPPSTQLCLTSFSSVFVARGRHRSHVLVRPVAFHLCWVP